MYKTIKYKLKNFFTNFFEKTPGCNLHDKLFNISPCILKEGNDYYLYYQIQQQNKIDLKHVVFAKKNGTKAYYFFSIPISQNEDGGIVKRNIKNDGFTDYAKNDSVFWLNQDGSEERIQIKT